MSNKHLNYSKHYFQEYSPVQCEVQKNENLVLRTGKLYRFHSAPSMQHYVSFFKETSTEGGRRSNVLSAFEMTSIMVGGFLGAREGIVNGIFSDDGIALFIGEVVRKTPNDASPWLGFFFGNICQKIYLQEDKIWGRSMVDIKEYSLETQNLKCAV